ncbi:hypothetical protein ASG48_05915 [Aurantimonas sp. Leaf443]|nr:hypothetical protein ASG48_05915 [Aurantimonas sp. Leaf443]
MPAGPGLIELAAVLDRNAAPGLHGGLLGLRGSPLTIDASKVERIGGQCAQVLLSAAATWQADGQPLSLVEPSAGFERDLQLLGLGVHDFLTTETAP